VNTKFGTVRIISVFVGIPKGWRILTWAEGQQIQNQLLSILEEYSIVEFEPNTGYLVGSGYGLHYENNPITKLGERFIRKICL
jgi:hypothetical protein